MIAAQGGKPRPGGEPVAKLAAKATRERMAMTALVLRRKSRQRVAVAMPASRTLSRGKQNFQESVDPVEREIVCVSGDGIGCPATRAKSPEFIYRNVLAGLKTRFPGLKSGAGTA